MTVLTPHACCSTERPSDSDSIHRYSCRSKPRQPSCPPPLLPPPPGSGEVSKQPLPPPGMSGCWSEERAEHVAVLDFDKCGSNRTWQQANVAAKWHRCRPDQKKAGLNKRKRTRPLPASRPSPPPRCHTSSNTVPTTQQCEAANARKQPLAHSRNQTTARSLTQSNNRSLTHAIKQPLSHSRNQTTARSRTQSNTHLSCRAQAFTRDNTCTYICTCTYLRPCASC